MVWKLGKWGDKIDGCFEESIGCVVEMYCESLWFGLLVIKLGVWDGGYYVMMSCVWVYFVGMG